MGPRPGIGELHACRGQSLHRNRQVEERALVGLDHGWLTEPVQMA
jgi:hypothetical protein